MFLWTHCLAEHITRSEDLKVWEEASFSTVGGSPGNTSIIMGLPDGDDLSGPDHRITPGSYLDQRGTASQKERTRNETDVINRSDMDMVTLPPGTMGPTQTHARTFVVWGAGNQGGGSAGNPGEGASVAGIVKVAYEFLQSGY